MLNRVILIGRLTRDPEMRTTNTGKNVVSFSIAVDKKFKSQDPNQPTADFFRVTAWDRTAEFVSNYLTKGRLVAVDGRLETRKFVDNSGNNREVVEITAENVQGLDRPKDEAGAPAAVGAPAASGGGYGGGGAPARPAAAAAAPSVDEYDPFADE